MDDRVDLRYIKDQAMPDTASQRAFRMKGERGLTYQKSRYEDQHRWIVPRPDILGLLARLSAQHLSPPHPGAGLTDGRSACRPVLVRPPNTLIARTRVQSPVRQHP
jgi:hypothetical protein